MSYIRSRGLGDLSAISDGVFAGLQPALQSTTAGTVGNCPSGQVKDIAGNCTAVAAQTSTFGKVADFFTDWFKQGQLAKGRAQGAAEGAALLAAQQQSPMQDYLPYILIGGGLLTAVFLLRK